MDHRIAEMQVVQLTVDQDSGLVAGARGTVVSVNGDSCTVEFLGHDGHTIGIFEIPASDLRVVDYLSGASVARE